MAPPQGGQQDQHQGLDLLWGVAFLVLVILGLWYFARGPILQGIFYIKLGEIYFISLFTDSLEPVRQQIHLLQQNPQSASLGQLQELFSAIGRPLRYPVAVLLLLLGGILYLSHPTLKFNHIFDMKRLRELEKDNWPQITPILSLDLRNEDIDQGPWAMGMSPMQFAKAYKLLKELPPDPKAAPHLRACDRVEVIEEKAEQVFTKQLGPVWRGVNKAPIHARALMAIFAAHGQQDKTSVAGLTRQIAISANKDGKLDFSNVDKILKKHYQHAWVQEAMGSHAYLYGVIASLLERSRQAGVLSSSDFLWLKPLDRSLWYVINGAGRRTPNSEVAGPFSHWLAEKAIGRKLTQPMVKNAITGLKLALKDIVYKPEQMKRK